MSGCGSIGASLIVIVTAVLLSSDAPASDVGKSDAWRRGYQVARMELTSEPPPRANRLIVYVAASKGSGVSINCPDDYDVSHLSTSEVIRKRGSAAHGDRSRLPDLLQVASDDDALWPLPPDIKASATAEEDYRTGWIKGCRDYTADHRRSS
jgi:hypothetical protein